MAKLNKFEKLTREELIRAVLELEDENSKLRPAPAKFKLGQVLFYSGKHPYSPNGGGAYFNVLSVENRMGKWFYGYMKAGTHSFNVFPEEKCRQLSKTEIDGSPSAVAETIGGLAAALQNAAAPATETTAYAAGVPAETLAGPEVVVVPVPQHDPTEY